MSTTKQRVLVFIAAAIAVISIAWWMWAWQSDAGAVRDERENQQRIRADLPRPNESAPKTAGSQEPTPR